jgi:hypothetical protein
VVHFRIVAEAVREHWGSPQSSGGSGSSSRSVPPAAANDPRTAPHARWRSRLRGTRTAGGRREVARRRAQAPECNRLARYPIRVQNAPERRGWSPSRRGQRFERAAARWRKSLVVDWDVGGAFVVSPPALESGFAARGPRGSGEKSIGSGAGSSTAGAAER